jgi:predicted transcriptional regulator
MPPTIGDRELLLLRHLTDLGTPVTVREVAEKWGEPLGLARTTILTMMERLRKKGLLLRRREADGATFVYSPVVEESTLLRGLVQNFVDTTLGGSVAPFVAYLSDAGDLSQGEIAELRRLVDALEQSGGGSGGSGAM